MRAARCTELGTVVVEDVLEPEPGPGQVLVAVGAAAANYPDLLVVEGRYQVKLEPPFTVGSELAGTVLAVGHGVAGIAAGDRVTATGMSGAFAERAVVNASVCRLLPDGVSDEVAAASGVTYLTALHALHTVGDLQPGQWVVVLGAAGGVGQATIDLARLHGARVLAVAGGAAKVAACRDAGAEAVVDHTTQDLKTAIKEATGGGAHLVIDPVGGAQSEQALRTLLPGGRFIVVGFASGKIPAIPLNLVLVKGISIHGLDLRHIGIDADAARTIEGHLAAGRLRPRIHARYPLAEVPAALAELAQRRAIGKVLVIP